MSTSTVAGSSPVASGGSKQAARTLLATIMSSWAISKSAVGPQNSSPGVVDQDLEIADACASSTRAKGTGEIAS
jgi:hypothetical protein